MKANKKYYKKFSTLFDKDSVVVDLGAYVGQFTLYFAKKARIVISVEPEVNNFIKIIKGIVENKFDNIIPICAAISDKTGTREIFLSKHSHSHSLMMKNNFGSLTPKRKIISLSWDDLMDSLHIPSNFIKKIDFAKVNIEGAEEMLLEGMTKMFPEKMVIEEHTKNGITDIYNLMGLLNQKGYKLKEVEDDTIYVERV